MFCTLRKTKEKALTHYIYMQTRLQKLVIIEPLNPRYKNTNEYIDLQSRWVNNATIQHKIAPKKKLKTI